MRKPSAPRPAGSAAGRAAKDEESAPVADRPVAEDGSTLPNPGRELVPSAQTRRDGGGLAAFGRRTSDSARADRRDRVVSTGLTDRLAERRRANRSLFLRRAALLLGAIVVVCALAWILAFSPLLALRTSAITVSGSDGTVTDEDVRGVLAGHAGTSLVRLDVPGLEDEVSDGLVRVKSATVTRSWPHGLAVVVTMRRPVAQHRTDSGYEVLDGEAIILQTSEQPQQGLAEITAEDGATPTREQIGAVAGAIGSLDEATRAQVVSGSATATGQVTLQLATGSKVVWGDASDSALKARVLAVLLGQEASAYNVSSPHSPTTS